METKLSLEELTPDTVLELSEEEVFLLLTKDINEQPKEKRSYYVRIIDAAFEFRTISSKNRSLRADLGMFGFKFYPIPNESKLMGVKRKAS